MNEQVEQVEQVVKMKTNETLSKYEVIGAVISVGVLGFDFGIGAVLGAKMVNGLEEIISRK